MKTMDLNIDLHTHSYFSGDGISSPEDMIAHARKKGLHGLAITDHNTCDAVDYLLNKGLMREDGLPVDDFLIIPGVEVTTAEGHLLCVGATLPNLKGQSAVEVCKIIHNAGGLAIPPHPYDIFRAGIRESIIEQMEIDAMEVFNAATIIGRYNAKAYTYAMRKKLPMIAGSDSHIAATVGTAYTIIPTGDFSVRGVLDQLLRTTRLNQHYLTLKDIFRKTWSNWGRLKKHKTIKETVSENRESQTEI